MQGCVVMGGYLDTPKVHGNQNHSTPHGLQALFGLPPTPAHKLSLS